MNLNVPRQMLEKIQEYQISQKSVQWEPSSPMLTDRLIGGRKERQTEGRTERHDGVNSSFLNFVNTRMYLAGRFQSPLMLKKAVHSAHVPLYVVGSRSFRPDIQKQRQVENAVKDI